VDIVPDGAGSVQLKLSWEPTNISSLKFINPPGGVTVPVSPTNVKYTARFRASDMYGGTTIGVYYTKDETKCSRTVKTCVTRADCPAGEVCTHSFAIGGTNLIGQRKKTTPGTNTMSMDWNIFGKPDGRYVLFAELVPGTNAGGTERAYSDPRAGRNNKGNGSLALNQVNIAGHAARSETWTVTCIDASQGKWQVNSNITQPALDSGTQQQDPYPRATTGTQYTSVGGEVKFTIAAGSTPFVVGDMFTFITTGITAPSASVNIIGGKISEDPVAIITATPLAGDPPLLVYFDGRKSRDPNGEPLTYLWNYGDGTAAESGAEPQHTFTAARTYTVVLKVTNPRNGRFGEAAVDIAVTNNSPKAVLSATPASGGADGKGLQVQLSGAQSSDRETSADKLIYHWDFGDGATANDALVPGKTFQTVPHLYKNDAQGRLCTHQLPCDFTATLKVIDEGGKSDSATAKIRVGNTNPVPNITYSSLQGPHPWAVTFNAINSYDAEKDTLKVDWDWNGDGTADEKDVPLTGTTTAKDGSVPHTYNLPAGQTTASFQTKAIVRDNVGGEATWAGVTVVVSAAATGVSDPRAIMSPTCDDLKPTVGKPFTVDGSLSFDRPAGSKIVSYTWDWGDGSPVSSGVKATHTYKQPGTYTIILTVADGDTPPKTNRTSCTVAVTGEGTGEEPLPVNRPPVALFTVDPENGFVGTEFTFDAGASADPDGDEDTLRYSWSFGDGQTATGVVVTHAYEQPKPEGYVVRLTVRDQRNASTEALREVIVVEVGGNLPPIAYIASGPRTGTAPLTLTFDGRNSYDLNGDPLEFRWDFTLNDGENDMLVGPVVTRVFDIAGEYTVSLEVLDGRGGVGNAGPETITVAAPTEAPPEPPTPRPEPDEGVVDDSSVNRPRPVGMCGLGMLPALIGSLSGLAVLAGSRRRFGL
jgi:PKD repeat protein